MEFENRNTRPEGSSNLPLIVLIALVCIIAALFYVGWKYQMGSSDEKLTNVTPDSMAVAISKPDVLEEATIDETPIKQGEKKTVNEKIDDEATATAPLEKPKKEKKKELEKPKEEIKKVKIPVGGESLTHTVQAGETFYGVANRYNLKFGTLQNLNPDIKPEGVKSGVTKLNVKIQAVHTVGAGDILRVVAKKYGITVEQLMAANKKTKNMAERGEKLVIPFGDKK
jgi:LysM repeat protein